MRVRKRLSDESGVTAVIVAILIFVIVGMLALTIDGGLLWTKYRRVRAGNDAAALAAAYSCATGEGVAVANTKANDLAMANVADLTQVIPNAYPEGCEVDGGEVTVRYGGQQGLLFGPAIGVSSPKPVVATATARWGGAAGATNVAPLMLSMDRLSSCGIPYSVAEGEPCFFWWDNGTAQDPTALTNAEWGLMDLRTWGWDRYASCLGNASQQVVSSWIANGFPGSLMMGEPPPTEFEYVCRAAGFQGNALNNDLDAREGDILWFPVNDPSQQVDSAGALCPPGAGCTVYKYAIVGFAALEVVHVWTGNDAQYWCGHPASNNGSLRCLETVWRGYQPGGLLGDGDVQNFGLFAVALTG